MKKLIIAAGFLALVSGFAGCGGAYGDNPGHAYMPDMYYSRAYETYGYNAVEGEMDSLRNRGVFYNGMPVPGTIARGESISYHLTADSNGLKSAAVSLRSPLESIAASNTEMKEAERLYLINCGICHGTDLNGKGPLLASGAYVAVPADLTGDAKIKSYSDGHYFHVITYGIRAMGSYKSQLTPEQRWWVIKYIRSKQAGSSTSDTTKTSTTPSGTPVGAPTDTSNKGK